MLASFGRYCSSTQSFIQSHTSEIVASLETLGINNEGINRIMESVQKMGGSTYVQGALDFLKASLKQKSVREAHYLHSKYFAEYFCTLSNLGLFGVGFYYKDYATLLAATFSALSHAIPSQRLHDLDFLGIYIILGKVAVNYKVVLKRPDVIGWGAGALAVNFLDQVVSRRYLAQVGPSFHVAWHLAAAFALYKFNKAQSEISEEELKAVSLATSLGVIPDFLKASFNKIQEGMTDLSNRKYCTIM